MDRRPHVSPSPTGALRSFQTWRSAGRPRCSCIRRSFGGDDKFSRMSAFRGSAAPTKSWNHFRFTVKDGVATLTFDRPQRLNALTFQAYADLRDLLTELPQHDDVRVLVITGTGRGFSSGGDVNEIIGELQKMDPRDLLAFTRMTGTVTQRMRDCPLPIIASVNGIAAGAGAVIALAADLRIMAASATFSFLFTKVRLSGGDMGPPSSRPIRMCRVVTWFPPISCRDGPGWAEPASCCCSKNPSPRSGRWPSAFI